jgi:hypothetical protein
MDEKWKQQQFARGPRLIPEYPWWYECLAVAGVFLGCKRKKKDAGKGNGNMGNKRERELFFFGRLAGVTVVYLFFSLFFFFLHN